MLALLAFPLTVEWIMRGPALVGEAPRNLRWSADGSILRFSWAKPDSKGEPAFKDYQVLRDGTGLGPATPEKPEDQREILDRGSNGRLLYAQNGDIYLRDDVKTEARKVKLDENADRPVLSEDGKAILYLRGGDAFRTELADGKTVQLTHLVLPSAAPASAGSGSAAGEKGLAEETGRLLKSYSPSGRGAAAAPARNGGGRGGGGRGFRGGASGGSGETGGAAIAIPAGRRAGTTTVSSSGRFVSVEVVEPAAPSRGTEVPSYATRDGYTTTLPSYPKVGIAHPHETLLVADLTTDKTYGYAPPRPGSIGRESWSPDGKTLAFWADAQDHKDAWLVAYDTTNGTAKTVWTEHDDAWVGGPGRGFLAWTPDGRLAFETENTGYDEPLSPMRRRRIRLASPRRRRLRGLGRHPRRASADASCSSPAPGSPVPAAR